MTHSMTHPFFSKPRGPLLGYFWPLGVTLSCEDSLQRLGHGMLGWCDVMSGPVSIEQSYSNHIAMFGRISIVFFGGESSIVIPSLVGTVYTILTVKPGYVSVAIVSISGVVVQ